MYSAKNNLKVWVSNATGPSLASTLITLPAGEVGFFTAAGAAIATTGTGHICFRKPDGQVLKSKEVTFSSAWKSGIKAYAAPAMGTQTVTVSTATVGQQYQLRIEMVIPGMQGPYFKHGNYVAVSGDTTTTIATALVNSINAAMAREDKDYFTISNSSSNVITIVAKLQTYVRGKKQGRPPVFRASLVLPEAYAALGVQTVAASDGIGYGPYICEKEYLAQGDSDPYRFGGYPNSFDDRGLLGLSTGKYNVLVFTEDTAVKTANASVVAPQEYMIVFNTIGVGTTPTITAAPDVSDGDAAGKGTPGDTVYIYDNGTLATGTFSALVDANGDWAIASGLTGITAGHTATVKAVAPTGTSSGAYTGVLVVA